MNLDKYPLVSVCMPAYNHENYIEEAILSVIEQTYQNIELIIINDGSSDKTEKKIELLEEKCKKRFVNFIYKNRKNKGASYTANEGLSLANGKYFMVTGSDDTQSKERISVFVEFMENNKTYNCAYSGYKDIDINNKVIRETISNKKIITFKDTIFGLYNASFISYIIKISFLKDIGKYNESIIMEDWELALRISSKKDIYFIDEALYNHRYHSSNTCTQEERMIDERFKILSFYKSHELYEKAYYIWKQRYLLINGQTKQEFERYVLNSKFFINYKKLKYLIYGNGTFGKSIGSILKNSLVAFIDKDTIELTPDHDYIIISVLGREEEIIKYLQDKFNIQQDKMITLM